MIAMSYGYVYVAQISMGADKNQTLKAIAEAGSISGTLAHHRIRTLHQPRPESRHGRQPTGSEKAVEAGYWGMYRYNPALLEQGKNPFSVDSKEPTAGFKEFLMGRSSIFFAAEAVSRTGGSAVRKNGAGCEGKTGNLQTAGQILR